MDRLWSLRLPSIGSFTAGQQREPRAASFAAPHANEEAQGLLQSRSLREPLPSQKELQSTIQGSSFTTTASEGKEAGICRICLEEDLISNLEAPCGCTGTQRYAHHACIQRWVDEKGNARCEICEQNYQGQYTVPPPPVGIAIDNMPVMYILESSDPRAMHRASLDLLDTDGGMYGRNPSVSWCVTFIVFFMFLVVLHHTLIVADGLDYDGDDQHGPGGFAPSDTDDGMGLGDGDSYTSGMLLFLFWVATKAFLIGVPLFTVMKIAARQARREQYEAMLRAGNAYEANRRMLLRMRSARANSEDLGPVPPPAAATAAAPPVANAV